MSITAAQVKELRQQTGAGMMECKKALTETNGNVEEAITLMRKKGQLKAAKRAGRTAAEGIIMQRISDDKQSGVMIEINCETDFVAKDENLLKFANDVADKAIAAQVETADALLALDFNGEHTVEQAREALVAKIGENVQIRRVANVKGSGLVGSYLHGSKIGVLVGLNAANEDISKDVAMHIAASMPKAITEEGVPSELIAKERDIYTAQAKESGKPDDIVAKMVEGRVKKFLKEVSLVDQPFVKDPNQTVGDLLKAADVTVEAFTRFEVGEGIEKEVTDFREEVMAQVKG